MLPTLLPVLLALAPPLSTQGAPAHAALHPSDAVLYVELGDVQGLLKAYQGAPLLKLVNDERIKSLVTEAGLPFEGSPQGLLAMATADADPQVAQLLTSLKGVSMSASMRTGSEVPVAVEVVLGFADAAQAAGARDMIVGMAPNHEPVTSTLPGVQRVWGATPAQGGWVAVSGANLVLGGGALPLEEYVGRSGGEGDDLAKHWKTPAAFGGSAGTTIGWFAFRSSPELVGMLSAMTGGKLAMLPPDMNPLGTSCVGRMQMVGDRFVTELFGEKKSDAPPIDPSWLAPVPDEAMFVFSRAVKGAQAATKIRELLAKDPNTAAMLSSIEEKVGFGPERLFAHLGPGMTAYLMPLAGMGLPESRLWIDCDDPAAFQTDLETFFTAMADVLPGYEVKSRPYKVKNAAGERVEYPVVTISLPNDIAQMNPMISLSPSFTVVGKKLVFALNSLDIKSELKRLYGEEAVTIDPAHSPLTAAGLKLPAGAQTVVMMDWAKLLKGVYDTAKMFASMQGDALPIDPAKLPPGEIFGEYLKPTLFTSTPVEGGQYRRNEASFGPEILGALTFGAAYAGIQRAGVMAMPPPAPQPTAPIAPGADDDESDT